MNCAPTGVTRMIEWSLLNEFTDVKLKWVGKIKTPCPAAGGSWWTVLGSNQ